MKTKENNTGKSVRVKNSTADAKAENKTAKTTKTAKDEKAPKASKDIDKTTKKVEVAELPENAAANFAKSETLKAMLSDKASIVTNTTKLKKRAIGAAYPTIQPWHHLLKVGNKFVKFVWDTRVVEEIIDVKTIKEDDLMSSFADKGLPLIATSEAIQKQIASL